MSQQIPRSLGTHDGAFHADEVTAAALLLESGLIDQDKIRRTRDPDLLATCEYVCDVGGIYDPKIKRFDHHQVEYQGLFSSAGMILQYLEQEGILSPSDCQVLRENLVNGIDDHDNGRIPDLPGHCTFSHVIANYAPIEREGSHHEEDACFFEAMTFVRQHIRRVLDRTAYVASCESMVKKAMEENQDYLFFDRNIPWIENFFALGGEQHPARFVIMPTGSHWKLRAVPPTYETRMKVRQPLPEEWAGLLDEDLKQATGISGAIFCHKGRFISVWETKEDALQAYELTKKEKV